MMRQSGHGAAREHEASSHELDALALRMRRLALHRGYERGAVGSPLLKRLMPGRKPVGNPAAQIAAMRERVEAAGLDRNAVVYLTESVEDELDSARLRLR